MEGLVESLTRGNVAEVKVVLASGVLSLALYQVVLISFAYGKLPSRLLGPKPAGAAHRAVGGSVVVLALITAFFCLVVHGFEFGDETVHVVAGTAVLAVLAAKIFVIHRAPKLNRALPPLGLAVLALFAVTWFSSAGPILGIG